MDIKEALNKLPKQPGIYFMKNSAGIVIYVGKAKSLKSRVSQYFQKNRSNSPKVNEMISQISTFEYKTTDTELEAFLMECRAIRELQPKYNRLLKNCKNYKYISISVNEEYPVISVTVRKKKDCAIYFGPFTSKSSVEMAIEFFKEYYPIKKCGNKMFSKNSSGCLHYQLGKCLGPCTNSDIQKEYRAQINRIILLLEGRDPAPVKHLICEMKAAAEGLDFERAVKYREQIKGIRHLINMQRIIKVSKYGRNILAAEKFGEKGYKLFVIKGNKLLHTEIIGLTEFDDPAVHVKKIATDFFKSTKTDKSDGMSQEEVDEAQIIYSYIKNTKNGIQKVNIPASRIDSLNYEKIIQVLIPEIDKKIGTEVKNG